MNGVAGDPSRFPLEITAVALAAIALVSGNQLAPESFCQEMLPSSLQGVCSPIDALQSYVIPVAFSLCTYGVTKAVTAASVAIHRTVAGIKEELDHFRSHETYDPLDGCLGDVTF